MNKEAFLYGYLLEKQAQIQKKAGPEEDAINRLKSGISAGSSSSIGEYTPETISRSVPAKQDTSYSPFNVRSHVIPGITAETTSTGEGASGGNYYKWLPYAKENFPKEFEAWTRQSKKPISNFIPNLSTLNLE